METMEASGRIAEQAECCKEGLRAPAAQLGAGVGPSKPNRGEDSLLVSRTRNYKAL